MQADVPLATEPLPITDVERLTGIRQATLRMWERRYGFPQPLRDRHGDRVYPPDQVERLQAALPLLRQGARPGKLFGGGGFLPLFVSAPEPASHHLPLIAHLRHYRMNELRTTLQHCLMALGMRRFVTDCLAPLSASVSEACRCGELPLRCVHLHTQLAASVLHTGIAAMRGAANAWPKAVIATLAGEPQVLDTLMAEAVLTALQVDCIALGPGMPPHEVAAAAAETGAGIVVLSFGAGFPRKTTTRMCVSLRAALPPHVALWIGGEGASQAQALPPGVDPLASPDAIDAALTSWRAQAA